MMTKLKKTPIAVQKQIEAKQRELEQMKNEEHKRMVDQCSSIALEVIKIAIEEKVEIGDITGQRTEAYQRACKRIQELFLERNLLWIDRQTVFMMVLQPFDQLKNFVTDDLNKSYEAGMCRMLGVPSFSEMTLQDLDKKFKENAAKATEKPTE